MAFDSRLWTRLAHDGVPVYVRPDRPDWFVPNQAGDALLARVATSEAQVAGLDERLFLQRLPDGERRPYRGRHELLRLEKLRELWFHVTNRCNLSCAHCLVSSSPREEDHLDAATILGLADQAARLGCSVFALTGGEPFLHRQFETIVDGLLARGEARVAILTNGMFLRRNEQRFAGWPIERLHLQISVDGLAESHDRTRGGGSFAKLERELSWLRERRIPFSVSMCVMRSNFDQMSDVVDFAAAAGASNVHFLWYFVRGRGEAAEFVTPDEIFERLVAAARRADRHGVTIDNIETLRSQLFAPAGTLHDGGNSGWESVAVGFDGKLYPSPALIGVESMSTPLNGDLERAWRDSPALDRLRRCTAAGSASPWRFLVGGGDHDHSLIRAGTLTGDDPYLPLYEKLSLWLIASAAAGRRDDGPAGLRLKMGDLLERCDTRGEVALTHSNCLLALATREHVKVIKEFYSRAAESPQERILNPACYPEEQVAHIPAECRVRSYGCGSPVLDAGVQSGETVVDLGSGAGVECLIASRLVGPGGSVIGIDMLDPMLALARRGAEAVKQRLGFGNVEFRKAYLESLPLEDDSADLVLSNCVLNLSRDKRGTFAEILRVLKPGGRLVVSDVVCESDPPSSIRNDDLLHGECIAGALTQRDLFGLLDESGFTARTVHKRFPYRVVRGHPFFSMTFEARKPDRGRPVEPSGGDGARRVMYRGPHAGVVTRSGRLFSPGAIQMVRQDESFDAEEGFLEIDADGNVVNAEIGESACCAAPPAEAGPADAAEEDCGGSAGPCCGGGEPGEESAKAGPCCGSGEPGEDSARTGPCCAGGQAESESAPLLQIGSPADAPPEKLGRDCMFCGSPLTYFTEAREVRCEYCRQLHATTAVCEKGHFVCDRCHAQDGVRLIEEICTSSSETDLLALLQEIRRHRAIPLHGPEHHALVPGVILATYRNLGGALSLEALRTGIQRGAQVAGGSCGFAGSCGAAVGVGIAVSVILESDPLAPRPRAQAMRATSAVLAEIARTEAPRCCQRESYVALKKAAELSRDLLPLPLRAEAPMRCGQMSLNTECIGPACPLIQDLIAARSLSG